MVEGFPTKICILLFAYAQNSGISTFGLKLVVKL